ncbi:FAD-dependent oxidoreductase [Galactobacter sp.]|uniref:FAD-dependent oxidoreductase n=1 Tax=Galactobacter sp. TaxID=2676125 RepID=UPI0025BAB0DB|nr:FAD-dependent oxidoreductase [Galactobacter sp.]
MSQQHGNDQWDVIVVGGGAAGLSAALMLGRARRRVLVIDAGRPRNRFASHMHGVLGHEGVDPTDLLTRGRKELETYDVTLRADHVERVADAEGGVVVHLADGEATRARALVVATGLTDGLPEVPGLAELWGTGVLHCPYCHGWEVRGQRLAVLGTSPISLHQAELIRQWSDRLTFFTAGCDTLSAEQTDRLRARGVELVDTPVAEVLSDGGRLTGVRLASGEEVGLDAVFVASAMSPNDEFLASMELERGESPVGSYIRVDASGRTSHLRIWAIGNVVDPAANVPVSMGAGAATGGAVNMALVTEDFDRAVANGGESAQYWEEQYAEQPRRWSGRVNATMASVVSHLPAGRALDLGCGEGGDAVWLAEQGWTVTAVDISATAIARGNEGAQDRGVADAITWVNHDLSTWKTEETFDLVTASFFHSTVNLPRTEILRRAAGRICPGGHLLVVSHVFESVEGIPPWALHSHGVAGADGTDLQARTEVLLTPEDEVAELALDESEWETVIQEIRARETTGPDGHGTATVKDGVLMMQWRNNQ